MTQIQRISVVVTGVVWALTVGATIMKYGTYSDRWDEAASAPQVTQVANEFLVGIVPWFVFAVGVTAVCLVVAITQVTTRRSDVSEPA